MFNFKNTVMKKLSILSVLVVMVGLLTAATSDLPKYTSDESNSTPVKRVFYLPYAEVPSVTMEKVFSKDEYVLWKCPSKFVKDFPGNNIIGKSFNYFVYKNGKFHLTVTELNKESVYNFFSEK